MPIVESVFAYLLGGPKVGGAQEERLNRWRSLPASDLAQPHARARYVAVHAVQSGRDPRRGRLLAVAAAGVRGGQLDLADCFLRVLRQDRAQVGAEVLRHGIGGEHQLGGVDPSTAMLEFLEYVGKSPLVTLGDDAGDRRLIERSVHSTLGYPFAHPWIELGPRLLSLLPAVAMLPARDWLAHCGLATDGGDHALGQAVAVAQLLQIVLAAAARAGLATAAQLVTVQESRP